MRFDAMERLSNDPSYPAQLPHPTAADIEVRCHARVLPYRGTDRLVAEDSRFDRNRRRS